MLDVAGGWGLGYGIFAPLAAMALIVDYMRHNGRARGRTRVRGSQNPSMSNLELSRTEIALALASALVLACYIVFILAPGGALLRPRLGAVAASFLTLFMLATLLGIGTAIGFVIVWSYDQYAR